jgi:hypothetical protein
MYGRLILILKWANAMRNAAEDIKVGSRNLSTHFFAVPDTLGPKDDEEFSGASKRLSPVKGSSKKQLLILTGRCLNLKDNSINYQAKHKVKMQLSPKHYEIDGVDRKFGLMGLVKKIIADAAPAQLAVSEAIKKREQILEKMRNRQIDDQLMKSDLRDLEAKIDQHRSVLSGSPKVAFLCILIMDSPNENGWRRPEVLDFALMPVSEKLIPYESSYELLVAKKLSDERRYFRKPLRYDAGHDVVFPDFELLDVSDKATPLEVFGRDDEKYEDRKLEKVRYYDQMYGAERWWKWIAAGEGATRQPPQFPIPS